MASSDGPHPLTGASFGGSAEPLGPLEKRELSVRFIPILCAVPLLYAHAGGFFARHGLSVDLRPAPGWSGIKELLVHQKIDAAHLLSPMPLACAGGIDGMPAPLHLQLIQNVNGQALVLAARHRELRRPEALRGLTFGVPYLYSMQYYLLCHYLAQQGLHPLRDVRIIEVVPPQMPGYLARGWLDGFFGPEPYPQLAVKRGAGFIYLLSKQIWDGHPCCGLATQATFASQLPNTARAFLRSVMLAQHALHSADAQTREAIAAQISGPAYLNLPDPTLVAQALVGEFPDGRGATLREPEHADFLPQPHHVYAEWILSQMQRWGQLALDVDRGALARQVFQAPLIDELAPPLGFAPRPLPPGLPTDPQGDVSAQPFAETRATTPPPRRYALPDDLRAHLRTLLATLAEVAGGAYQTEITASSDDEVGWLEQMISEIIRNARFAQQALREQLRLEEEAHQKEALIESQKARLRELSTPIIPLISSALLVPLIGTVDVQRAQQVAEQVLAGVVRHRARYVMLDITGLTAFDQLVVEQLRRLIQAVRLLGGEAVLIGVSPEVSRTLVAQGVEVTMATVQRDLASAIEYVLERLGLTIVRKPRSRG